MWSTSTPVSTDLFWQTRSARSLNEIREELGIRREVNRMRQEADLAKFLGFVTVVVCIAALFNPRLHKLCEAYWVSCRTK